MIRAEMSVEIARPAEEVFAFLADLENDAKWVRNWWSKRLTETRGLGARYARWYRIPFGKPMEATVVVTAYEPPHRFAFESRTGPGVAYIEYRLDPAGTATRVTKVEELRHGGLLGLVNKLFAPVFRREVRTLLANLKRVIEERGGAMDPSALT